MSKENLHIKKFEIIIILLGIIITAILGYGQWKIGETQNLILKQQIESQKILAQEQLKSQKQQTEKQLASQEKQTIDQIEIQTMNLVASHFSSLGEDGEEGKKAERAVMIAANFLSDTYGRRSLAEMAKELINDSQHVDAEVVLRVTEAAEPLPEKNPSWFTVIGSFDTYNLDKAEQKAAELSETIKKATGDSLKVSIYKTKFSSHYAIVVGKAQSKELADQLAYKARKLGWAKDAYSQIDRDWKQITFK